MHRIVLFWSEKEADNVRLYKIFIGWPRTQLQGPALAGAAANSHDKERRRLSDRIHGA